MSTSGLLEGVKDMCKVWGAQRRYKMNSKEQGWNGASMLEKFRQMHDGAGSGTQRVSQFMEESFVGEGLLVHRALQGAPLALNEIVFINYAIPGKAKQKIPLSGLSAAEYWRDLGNAHYWILAKLPVDTVVDTTVDTRKAG